MAVPQTIAEYKHSSQATDLRLLTESVSTRLAFWALCALIVAISLLPLVAVGNASGQGNILRQAVYLLIAGTATICSQLSRRPYRLLVIPPTIWAVMLWACLSLTWAINPDIAFRRLFLTLIIIFSVFVLVREAGYRLTIQAMRLVLPTLLAANYMTVFLAPEYGIHQTLIEGDPSVVGSWHGILMDKNFAGAICALTMLLFLFDAQSVGKITKIIVLSGSAYFLWRTNSKTSLALLATSAAAAKLTSGYNQRSGLIALHAIILSAIGAWFASQLAADDIDIYFSREDSLTGRVQIWPLLINYIKTHPTLGTGFGSFWNIGGSEPIFEYTRGWISRITSGHNGFLDLTVQLGLPGLALVLMSVLIAPARIFLFSNILASRSGALLLSLVMFTVLHNLTETSLYDRDAAVYVFLMMAIAMLHIQRDFLDARR